MVQQIIDTTTDHGTYKGDPGKTAFEKTKANFAELYQLFQTAANKLGYFDGNGKPSFTDITNYARSILGGADAATVRSVLGLNSGAVSAVLGTIANGSIIEVGANSNGSYIRFAGGKQICRSTSPRATANSAYGSGYMSAAAYSVFPAAFSSPPISIPWTINQVNGIVTPWGDTVPNTTSCSARVFGFVQNASAELAFLSFGDF